MRILLVHNYYRGGAPGGEDIVFDAERRLLETAGYEVRTYTRRNDEMDEHSRVDQLATVTSLMGRGRTRGDLAALFKAWRPDIVHVHNTFPLISRAIFDVCSKFEIPSVQTVHNYRWVCAAATHLRDGRICTECDASNLMPAIKHRCYRGSLAGSIAVAAAIRGEFAQRARGGGATRYLALTQFAADRLQASGVDAARIRIRPNFIEQSTGAANSSASHESYAVFTGKLAIEKGLRTLLMAWRDLADIPLVIVGDGPLRAELEAYAREHKLRQVSFVGLKSREETRRLVADAALQVVPSEWFEGMPMVVLEAWSAGTPVIASAIGGLAEMIGNDERGLSFRTQDSESLVRQVRHLWGDTERRNELVAAGRDQIARHHTPEAGLRSLNAIYAELVT